MASVTITGVDDVRTLLLALGGEMKAASDKAQTRMAYAIREGAVAQMVADLDRPNPWTLGGGTDQAGPRYKAAGRAATAAEIFDGCPAVDGAAVYFRAPIGGGGLTEPEYIGVQIAGGLTAGPRASEKRLQQLGWIKTGQVWVPDRSVKLDAYGNVPGSVITAMLSDIGAIDTALRADGTCCKYFAPIGKPPNVKGVRAKIGDDWYPFLWFVPRASYSARFDFYGRVDRDVQYSFKDFLDDEITYALKKL